MADNQKAVIDQIYEKINEVLALNHLGMRTQNLSQITTCSYNQ